MSRLVDEVARTLATPMPRRKLIRTLASAIGGAALVALFPRQAAAALACGTTSGTTQSGFSATGNTYTCTGTGAATGTGEPNAAMITAALANATFACTSTCPTRTAVTFRCTRPAGAGNCNAGNPCSMTTISASCSCTPSSCTSGTCCCSTNGTCQPSVGGSGNCRSGFAGC